MGLDGADGLIWQSVAAAVAGQHVAVTGHHPEAGGITWDKLVIMLARCTQVRWFTVASSLAKLNKSEIFSGTACVPDY